MLAADEDAVEGVIVLMKAGADVHWQNMEGNTALHYARHPKIVEMLSKARPDDEVIFEIGEEDDSCQEFRSSGFEDRPEYTCFVGTDCSAENFPHRDSTENREVNMQRDIPMLVWSASSSSSI